MINSHREWYLVWGLTLEYLKSLEFWVRFESNHLLPLNPTPDLRFSLFDRDSQKAREGGRKGEKEVMRENESSIY